MKPPANDGDYRLRVHLDDLLVWVITAVAAPLTVGVCSQLFAERARKEHLRLARDQLELAALVDSHLSDCHDGSMELRARAVSEMRAYLRPPWRPKYGGIIFAWVYVGIAAALLILAMIQESAEAGPGPWLNWLILGLLGAAGGTCVAVLHISLKDQILGVTNLGLARLTKGRVRIPRPSSWGPRR